MPHFATQHFGRISYEEDCVFHFSAGLPGFEDEHRFVPVEHPSSHPIVFLQSLSRSDLCFITLPALAVGAGYRLALSAEDLRLLGLEEDRQPVIGRDVLCLAIVSVAEGKLPTANLLAPVVVNLKTLAAVQAIQETEDYSHQHPLLAPEAACS